MKINKAYIYVSIELMVGKTCAKNMRELFFLFLHNTCIGRKLIDDDIVYSKEKVKKQEENT